MRARAFVFIFFSRQELLSFRMFPIQIEKELNLKKKTFPVARLPKLRKKILTMSPLGPLEDK